MICEADLGATHSDTRLFLPKFNTFWICASYDRAECLYC